MQPNDQHPVSHYYGDITRSIFIGAALVLLLGLPTVSSRFGLPVSVAIFGIVMLVIAAGITNPIQRISLVLNVLVSLAGLAIFTYISWFMYTHSIGGIFLVLNQVIAVLFLVASYLSIKSARGYLLNRR